MSSALNNRGRAVASLWCAAVVYASSASAQGYFVVGQPLHGDAARPSSGGGALRALRVPVRVHAAAGTASEEWTGALRDAERAYEILVDRLHLTAPLFDGTRGGGPELDLYLVDDVSFVRTDADALDYGELWDCSPSVIRVRRGLEPRARMRAITEGIAHASLLAADARTPRSYRVAFAAALAARALSEGADEEGLTRAAPLVADGLFSAREDEGARGDAVFFDLLASKYDDPSLTMLRGLAVMPVARTGADAGRFADEPDPFDALRRLLRSEPGGFDGFVLDYYAARALTGTPGDRFDSVGFRALAKLAPEPAYTVRARDLPRYVTSPRPLAQTGASYVVIDAAGLQEGTLSLWFHGASWRRWTVTAVRLDALDRDRGRASSPPVNDGEWSTTMELNETDAKVLVVVVDQGNQLADMDRPTNRDGSFSLNMGLSNVVTAPAAR